MKNTFEYRMGDMLLAYHTDEQDRVSMSLVPAALRDRMLEKDYEPEPIVQIHARIVPCAAAAGVI